VPADDRRGGWHHLIDDRGRRLLDVCSGPFLAAVGQGNERVLQAMLDQGRRLTCTYSRTTRHHANAALTERLAALAGAGFERAHLTSGGSEAVEMALKFLRAHAVASGQAERHRVISLMPGYHGATLQTLGLTGDVRAPGLWGSVAVYSQKIPAPLTFRAASPEPAAAASLAALEETIGRIGPGRVLAFVMEPIGGQASGVNVPHPPFARGARAICDRHGIRLVFDQSVCAVRTGPLPRGPPRPRRAARRGRARQGPGRRLRAARRGADARPPGRGTRRNDRVRRFPLPRRESDCRRRRRRRSRRDRRTRSDGLRRAGLAGACEPDPTRSRNAHRSPATSAAGDCCSRSSSSPTRTPSRDSPPTSTRVRLLSATASTTDSFCTPVARTAGASVTGY
jgi:Aminotransferase class-III